jgi:hypothetical protein
MIGAVDQDDLDGRPTEGFGGGQPSKASADDNDTRQMFVHIYHFERKCGLWTAQFIWP